jgi:large subunit ribosomal protein L25
MAKQIKLNVEKRTEENGKLAELRVNGYLPAVIYGPNIESESIKVKKQDFEEAFQTAGESQLIDLTINGKKEAKTLIKDVQRDPVKDNILHVDFYQVDMDKKIDVVIPINFINEPPAVKELGGTLVKTIESLEATCLPGDLVDKFDVDLSPLNSFEDYIRISDLNIPENIQIYQKDDAIIAHVMEPEKEVEEEKPEGEEAQEGEVPKEGEEEKKEEKSGQPEQGGEKVEQKKE